MSKTRLSNFHFHMNFQGTQFSSWQKYISGSIVLFQIHQRKKVKLLSCVRLCDPMDCSLPCTIHGIFRQEYWSGLPFPPPEDLTNPGTEPVSPALQADALLYHLSHQGSIHLIYVYLTNNKIQYDKVIYSTLYICVHNYMCTYVHSKLYISTLNFCKIYVFTSTQDIVNE